MKKNLFFRNLFLVGAFLVVPTSSATAMNFLFPTMVRSFELLRDVTKVAADASKDNFRRVFGGSGRRSNNDVELVEVSTAPDNVDVYTFNNLGHIFLNGNRVYPTGGTRAKMPTSSATATVEAPNSSVEKAEASLWEWTFEEAGLGSFEEQVASQIQEYKRLEEGQRQQQEEQDEDPDFSYTLTLSLEEEEQQDAQSKWEETKRLMNEMERYQEEQQEKKKIEELREWWADFPRQQEQDNFRVTSDDECDFDEDVYNVWFKNSEANQQDPMLEENSSSLVEQFLANEPIATETALLEGQTVSSLQDGGNCRIRQLSDNVVALQLPTNRQPVGSGLCGSYACINSGLLCMLKDMNNLRAALVSRECENLVMSNASEVAIMRADRARGARFDGSMMHINEMSDFFGGDRIAVSQVDGIFRTIVSQVETSTQAYYNRGQGPVLEASIRFSLQANNGQDPKPEVFVFNVYQSHWLVIRLERMSNGMIGIILVDSICTSPDGDVLDKLRDYQAWLQPFAELFVNACRQ